MEKLSELGEAILRSIESGAKSRDRLMKSHTQGPYGQKDIESAIASLYKDRGYIKTSKYLRGAVYVLGEPTSDGDFEERYAITDLGKSYLAQRTANFTSFSNISNSNIAHQSPNAQLSIDINQQPQDIQEKIKELELAILKKDASAMKKAFGYITDKSVDVGIALLTGVLLK